MLNLLKFVTSFNASYKSLCLALRIYIPVINKKNETLWKLLKSYEPKQNNIVPWLFRSRRNMEDSKITSGIYYKDLSAEVEQLSHWIPRASVACNMIL